MGSVVTFYSYKGGVGRSMALANAGVLLAQWGYNVLLIDFDLEAPGLESFFDQFLPLEAARKARGVVDYFCDHLYDSSDDSSDAWRAGVLEIRLPRAAGKLSLWTAGRQGDDYFRNVRKLDFPEFYSSQNGGLFIERLRNRLKESYDFVLVDSRTGLTEIGGVCTVQLPDLIVLLFTATEQAFRGGLDIIKRAAAARQRLPFERVHVPAVPIPSRLDVQSEFRLAQKWLDRFARDLRDIYSSWLPQSVRPRTILEITKLPQISYFSYGETLPVIEQGTTDPSGLGYAYESLSALVARNVQDVEILVNKRDEYVQSAVCTPAERPASRGSVAKIFISYSHKDEEWLQRLRTHLLPLTRSRRLSLWDDNRISGGEDWKHKVAAAISKAEVAVLLVSPDYLASRYILDKELPGLLRAAEEQGLPIVWVALKPSLFDETEIGRFQALNDPSIPLSELSESEQDRSLSEVARKIAAAAGRKY